MVNFNEIYHFSKFQRGSNIFQGGGGSNCFQGGSNCLFPIETHITCDFPGGGGVRTPCHPSGSALEINYSQDISDIKLVLKRVFSMRRFF